MENFYFFRHFGQKIMTIQQNHVNIPLHKAKGGTNIFTFLGLALSKGGFPTIRKGVRA